MKVNELYLAVIPLIYTATGLTEQAITLFPSEDFASEFFPDEVEGYMQMFLNRTTHLSGGHVAGYRLEKVPTGDGRFIVKVIQVIKDGA